MAFKGDLTKKYFTTNFTTTEGHYVSKAINLLHDAVIRGDEELIKLLLAAGFDINAKGGKAFARGRELYISSLATPLNLAILLNNEEMVKLLIGYGADVNLGYDGLYPLFVAVTMGLYRNEPNIIKLLIKAGADVNKRSLLWIIPPSSSSLFKLLLEAGADPNQLIPNLTTIIF